MFKIGTALAISSFLVIQVYCQEYLPTSTSGEVIRHSSFTLSYSPSHEQAEWVYYYLVPKRVTGFHSRTDDFREDPAIAAGSASLMDYKNSAYDRGHLCPAADNTHSLEAMRESFLLSNIAPQNPGFNRGVWKRLEGLFRAWAVTEDGIYVVTAGVLTNDLSYIGGNMVAVPRYFYKIGFDPDEEKMIAFLLPHASSKNALSDYCTSVDNIERLTGIDFFPSLENHLEDLLESGIRLDNWDVNASYSAGKSQTSTPAIQCKGIAKSTGVQCKNQTTNQNGFCYHHQNQVAGSQSVSNPQKRNSSVQCLGATKAGSRCRNRTLNMNGYCHLHQSQLH